MCGDEHNIKKIGFNQAQEVSELISADNNSHIILEDFNDISGTVEGLTAFFEDHFETKDTVQLQQQVKNRYQKIEAERVRKAERGEHLLLFLVPYFANEHGVEYTNVDFRNTFSSDMQPYNVAPGALENQVMAWMLQRKVEQIASFSDNEVLNDFYRQKVQQFRPFMNYICSIMKKEKLSFQELSPYLYNLFLKNPEAYNSDLFLPATKEDNFKIRDNLTDIIAEIKGGNVSDRVKADLQEMIDYLLDLCTIDLIDAQILHELFQKQILPDVSNVVMVCCGKAHAQAVENVLPSLGYKEISSKSDGNGVDLKTFCELYLDNETEDAKGNFWHYITDAFSYVVSLFV